MSLLSVSKKHTEDMFQNQGWNIAVSVTGASRDVICPDQECDINQVYDLSDPNNPASEVNGMSTASFSIYSHD